MADNEELIGGIGITISGDYSSLKDSYSQAQADAAAAGEAVAGAFNDGVESVSDASKVVADGLSGISDAADSADGSLGQFADAAETAGEASEQAGGKLADMAEKLTAVGEALVITEGLKELGTEALGAADSITRASIALTTITGSGDSAKETIEGLEQLGMSDGLAMPSLLSAATRMQAILGPGAEVGTELKTIADGAAVMGTDIETAAQKFDMLATAGMASARTLTALGLSLGSLATAFNAVQGGSDATAASVAAMFKELDQEDRINVLNQALSGLGGTAEQVAQQTFGGQWQQLANEWEATMAQVGQAILPLVSDLLEFAKDDVVAPIRELATDFNQLSPPIKDAVVAVGLVAAAVIPLTGLAAAAGIALAGLGQLTEALGISSGEAAISQGAEAESIAAVGTAAGVASPEVSGLGAAEETAGAAGVTANAGFLSASAGVGTLLIGVTAIVAEIGYLVGAYDQMRDAQIKAKQSTDDAGQSAVNLSIKLQGLGADTTQLDLEWAAHSITLQGYVDGLMKLVGAYSAAEAAQSKQISVDADVAAGIKGIISSVNDSAAAYNVALGTYQKLQESLQTGIPLLGIQAATTQDVAKAWTALQTAAAAAGITLAPIPGSVDAITQASTKWADSGKAVVSALQQQENEQTVANASLDLASKAYVTSEGNLQAYVSQLHDAETANDGSAKAIAAVVTAEQNVQKAYAASQKASQDYATTVQNYAETLPSVASGEQTMLSDLEHLQTQLGPTMSAFLGIDAAVQAVASQLPNFGVQTVNISTGPLIGLQSALTEASAHVQKFAADMAAGQSVGQQYEKALNAELTAQINLNVATAEAGTGLQGATDAYSLATIAVAAAQAKLDTLTTAFQTNVTLAPQVTAAQNALATALKNQAAAANSSTSAADLLSQQYPQLNAAADSTTATINAQTTSLQNNVAALNSVAAAVKGVESDISNALGLASSGSATGGTGGAGGPGWVTTNTGMHGDFGQPITSTSYIPNTTQQALQGAIDAGEITVAQALQTEQAYNSIGYNDNWTFTPKGGGSTAAQAGSTQAGASGVQQSGVVLDPTQNAPALPGTTTASTGTVSSGSTPVVSSTSGGGTSAVDGGSYPAVTAHQAVGEVWAVSTSGQSGGAGGGGSTSITTSISNTLSGGSTDSASLQAATQAIGGAVQQIATNSGDLLPISASLQATAQSTAALAVAVGGLVVKLGGGTSGSLPTVTGGSGTAYSVGPTQTYSGSGNPLGDTAPPSNTPVNTVPGYNPFGGGSSPGPTSSGAGSQVTVNVDARGAVGINTAAMSAQISAIVGTTLVANLRAQGARF